MNDFSIASKYKLLLCLNSVSVAAVSHDTPSGKQSFGLSSLLLTCGTCSPHCWSQWWTHGMDRWKHALSPSLLLCSSPTSDLWKDQLLLKSVQDSALKFVSKTWNLDYQTSCTHYDLVFLQRRALLLSIVAFVLPWRLYSKTFCQMHCLCYHPLFVLTVKTGTHYLH